MSLLTRLSRPTHRDRLYEIGAESGLEFICSLNDSPSPELQPHDSGSNTGIGTLSSREESGSGRIVLGVEGLDQLLCRHHHDDTSSPLAPGDMIDIMGGPCTGKTMLLYAIIISTILPKAWKHSRSRPALILNNKPAQSVVFLDLDQGFSAERLKILLCRRIREKLQGQELSYSEFASRQEQKQDQEQGLNLEEEDWDIEVDQHLNLEAERVAMDKGEVNQHDPTSTRGVESNATTTTTNATLPHQEPYIPIDIDSPEITAKIEHLALSCLDAVHVFRPRDAVSAVVILRTLDQYMAQQTKKSTLDQESLSVASCSNNKQPSTENDTVRARNKTRLRRTCPPFGLVLIDSLSSFYWQERAQQTHQKMMNALVDAINRLCPPRAGSSSSGYTTLPPPQTPHSLGNIGRSTPQSLHRQTSSPNRLIFISTSWSLVSSTTPSSTTPSSLDRTVTDPLRGRLKYRFVMQPRNLAKFPSEYELVQSWRQQRLSQESRNQPQTEADQDLSQQDVEGSNSNNNRHRLEQSDIQESVFQVQMVIPSVPNQRQQVFRYSLSDARGIHTFPAFNSASNPPLLPTTRQ